MQVEAVTAIIVHMLKLKEKAGHLRVIDRFLQFPLVDFTVNSLDFSKRQWQQGQKREMGDLCWELVPHVTHELGQLKDTSNALK